MKIPENYPPRHNGRFLVRRPLFSGTEDFIATVCYGLHDPWWCLDILTSTVPMKDGDEWEPWPIGRIL